MPLNTNSLKEVSEFDCATGGKSSSAFQSHRSRVAQCLEAVKQSNIIPQVHYREDKNDVCLAPACDPIYPASGVTKSDRFVGWNYVASGQSIQH